MSEILIAHVQLLHPPKGLGNVRRLRLLSVAMPSGDAMLLVDATPRHRTLCRRTGHPASHEGTWYEKVPGGEWARRAIHACTRCGARLQ